MFGAYWEVKLCKGHMLTQKDLPAYEDRENEIKLNEISPFLGDIFHVLAY